MTNHHWSQERTWGQLQTDAHRVTYVRDGSEHRDLRTAAQAQKLR